MSAWSPTTSFQDSLFKKEKRTALSLEPSDRVLSDQHETVPSSPASLSHRHRTQVRDEIKAVLAPTRTSNMSLSDVFSDAKPESRRDEASSSLSLRGETTTAHRRGWTDKTAGGGISPSWGPSSAERSLPDRGRHEERNARVVSLLRAKDDAIEALEARSMRMEEEAKELRERLHRATRELDEVRGRAEELEEISKEHKRRANELQEQVALEREEAARNSVAMEELREARAENAAARNQVASLTAALQAADDVMEEMQGQMRDLETREKKKESRMEGMKEYIGRLLGIGSDRKDGDLKAVIENAVAHRRRRVVATVDKAAHNESTEQRQQGEELEESRIRLLEKANNALESALVGIHARCLGIHRRQYDNVDEFLEDFEARKRNVGSDGMSLDPQERTSDSGTSSGETLEPHKKDVDEVVRLSMELAVVERELKSERDRSQCLEETRALAQRAALHAESELQAVLERESLHSNEVGGMKDKLKEAEARISKADAELTTLRQAKQEVEEELGQIKAKLEHNTNLHLSQMKSMSENLAAMEELKTKAEKAAREYLQSSVQLQETADRERSSALEKAEASLQQCQALKAQIIDAQKENDEMKWLLVDYEKKIAFISAKEAANERSMSNPFVSRETSVDARSGLVEADMPTENVCTSMHVDELSHKLHEAVSMQRELHTELLRHAQRRAADQRIIARQEKSLKRLRAALMLQFNDVVNSASAQHASWKASEDEAKDGLSNEYLAQETSELEDKIIEELQEDARSLRHQLERSIAAQEGQTAAFVSITSEWRQHESSLHRAIHKERKENRNASETMHRMEKLCCEAVTVLQNALAHIAVAEGKDEEAEMMLRYDPMWGDLEPIVSETTERIQELARLIARNRRGSDVHEASTTTKTTTETSTILNAQRDVIRSLAEQLSAEESIQHVRDVFNPVKASSKTHVSKMYAKRSSQNIADTANALLTYERNEREGCRGTKPCMYQDACLGLCLLLSHQMGDVRRSLSSERGSSTIATTPSATAALETMIATLKILEVELRERAAVADEGTRSRPTLLANDDEDPPTAALTPEASISTSTNTTEEKQRYQEQVISLTEDLATTKERIELLIAANEAAQEGEAHAKASVSKLSEALAQERAEREKERALHDAMTKQLEGQVLEMRQRCLELERTTAAASKARKVETTQESAVVRRALEVLRQIRQAMRDALNDEASSDRMEEDVDDERRLRQSAVTALLNGMEQLLTEAADMEAKIRRLEAATNDVEPHSRRYRSSSRHGVEGRVESVSSEGKETVHDENGRSLRRRGDRLSSRSKALEVENARLRDRLKQLEIERSQAESLALKELQETRNMLKMQEYVLAERKTPFDTGSSEGSEEAVGETVAVTEVEQRCANLDERYKDLVGRLEKAEKDSENLGKASKTASAESLRETLERARASQTAAWHALEEAHQTTSLLAQRVRDVCSPSTYETGAVVEDKTLHVNEQIERLGREVEMCAVCIEELEALVSDVERLAEQEKEELMKRKEGQKVALEEAKKSRRSYILHDAAGRIERADRELQRLQAEIDEGFEMAGVSVGEQ